MTHPHVPAATGIRRDGRVCIPCAVPECDAGFAFELLEHRFPLAVCGVPLDLQDVEGVGAIVKLACDEATYEYRLDSIPLAPDALVLDIGAHVGTVSCYFAKTRSDLRVVAVEPGDPQWALLSRNVEVNLPPDPPSGRHHAYHVAVTGDRRTVALAQSPMNSGSASIYTDGEATIQSVTLTDLLDEHGPRAGLLKIDCEGAEHEVLTDDVLDRVDYLVGEFHHCPARGHDAHALLDRVRARLGADRVRVTVVEVAP